LHERFYGARCGAIQGAMVWLQILAALAGVAATAGLTLLFWRLGR
jgi:hypothetical protein